MKSQLGTLDKDSRDGFYELLRYIAGLVNVKNGGDGSLNLDDLIASKKFKTVEEMNNFLDSAIIFTPLVSDDAEFQDTIIPNMQKHARRLTLGQYLLNMAQLFKDLFNGGFDSDIDPKTLDQMVKLLKEWKKEHKATAKRLDAIEATLDELREMLEEEE